MSRVSAMFVLFLVAVAVPAVPSAQEMRRLNPIPTPAAMRAGTRPMGAAIPVDTQAVRDAVQRLAGTWNTGTLDELVSDSYYDKSRLMDAMVTEVPRNARLRVLSVGAIQTVGQTTVDDPARGPVRISTVTVTASTQIELNDPANGFVRVPGTNEITLEVIERIR